MSIDTQNINVLNYNENEVFADSAKEHYVFSASRDGVTPSIVPMSLSELQYIASNTSGIITGWLTFDEEDKEEIFKLLRIANWRDILTNEDIKNILTNPTIEGLQRIIDIDNPSYFDRVRIIMFKLLNNGVDITTKVSRIVDTRYNELRNKQRISSIRLTQKDTQKYATPNEIKELSDQNAALQAQLDEMKKMMEQMMNAKSVVSEKEESSSKPATRKPGRPKKSES